MKRETNHFHFYHAPARRWVFAFSGKSPFRASRSLAVADPLIRRGLRAVTAGRVARSEGGARVSGGAEEPSPEFAAEAPSTGLNDVTEVCEAGIRDVAARLVSS